MESQYYVVVLIHITLIGREELNDLFPALDLVGIIRPILLASLRDADEVDNFPPKSASGCDASFGLDFTISNRTCITST